jgi:hypothetical protein
MDVDTENAKVLHAALTSATGAVFVVLWPMTDSTLHGT